MGSTASSPVTVLPSHTHVHADIKTYAHRDGHRPPPDGHKASSRWALASSSSDTNTGLLIEPALSDCLFQDSFIEDIAMGTGLFQMGTGPPLEGLWPHRLVIPTKFQRIKSMPNCQEVSDARSPHRSFRWEGVEAEGRSTNQEKK